MRAALWFLALFGIAAALALFAGNNQSTVTLYWPPYRVDLSLNLTLLLLALGFGLLYAATRALSTLFDLPQQARQWRAQQRERAMHASLLDGVSHLMAGRFIRARKLAENALAQEQALADPGTSGRSALQLRALAHMIAAESAQALQDRAGRDDHLKQALKHSATSIGPETHDGALLQAARWALDDRDPQGAIGQLNDLPIGTARRTLALRLKLKAARQARQTVAALDTARLLAKHRAFSEGAAASIVRGLASELIRDAHDPAQLRRAFATLEANERSMPELAILAAQRMVAMHGDAGEARQWLLPVWQRMVESSGDEGRNLSDPLRVKLVQALEASLVDSTNDAEPLLEKDWLARIETAQQKNPRDANLQYLAGIACKKRQLWGKSQQLLTQAAMGLRDPGLHRNAWCALAELAEQRGDTETAAQSWKRAATS